MLGAVDIKANKEISCADIPFTSIVQSLPDFIPSVGPETLKQKYQKSFVARVDANESAFGICSSATEAIRDAAGSVDCSWYAYPENYELRCLLSEKHKVSVENLCVNTGNDSLLGLTVSLFVDPVTAIVSSLCAYQTVNYHANGYGTVVHSILCKDHHEDPVALVDAAKKYCARLVYLANPDNPMSTCLSSGPYTTCTMSFLRITC